MRKKEVAKESNKIARAKISPPPASVWEERIIALVTAKNKDADRDFSLQTIPVTELTGEKKTIERTAKKNNILCAEPRKNHCRAENKKRRRHFSHADFLYHWR